jgi:hypothetical protein
LLAALPSTRTIPDRDVFYVADPSVPFTSRKDTAVGIEHGELLRKAVAAGFDVPVTINSNMLHCEIRNQVVVLRGRPNRLADNSSADAGIARRSSTDEARHITVSS